MGRHELEMTPQDTALHDLQAYFKMVFGYCEGFVAVRMLREKGAKDANPHSLYLELKDGLVAGIAERIGPAAKDQRGLYVVPCTIMKPGNAKADNISQTCVIPVDLDTGDIAEKRAHLEHHLGTASMVVRSGGKAEDGQDKLHLYWQLTEACSGEALKQIAEVRSRLITIADADPSFQRLTQPIRVPGSIHGKHGIQTPVRILFASGREYDLDDLFERAHDAPRLPSLPPRDDFGGVRRPRTPVAKLLTEKVRAGAKDESTRFAALSRVIGHWVRLMRLDQATTQEARSAVQDYNEAQVEPPLPDDRVEREFRALLAKDRRENSAAWAQHTGDLGDDDKKEVVPPPSSEDALADTFVQNHSGYWRYVAPWGAWLHWRGDHWSVDETQFVVNELRQVTREAAVCLKENEARRLASNKTIRAVERIASSDPRIAVRPTDWDSDSNLFNTPGGTLDLDTGEVLDHDPKHLLTQIAAAQTGGDCPIWHRFLTDITGGNQDLQSYLARICGYCLTGDTSEQVFFFFHGAGANGKSVFLQTISKALGSYAATAPLDSFMVGRASSHPTDLAGLRGKRLVTVPETEPGQAWAETRIKTITGGDPIRARLLYRDFFEFVPTFKLIVAGNHRPQLTSVGEAMRRRLQLVPFDVTIPPERRDKSLPKRLEDELSGILDWMLDGHRDWQKRGLSPPSAITDASEAYFGDEDLIGQWLREQCDVGQDLRAPSRTLFENWSAWAEANGTERGSQKMLGEALRSRSFRSIKNRVGRSWQGLAPRMAANGVDR